MAFNFQDNGWGGTGVGLNPQTLALGPAGAFLGKQMGFFGKNSAPNFNDIIAQRQADIDAFANKLNLAQNNILNNYQNLQSTTMKRFMPDLTANLAGRGLAPNGGAFASAVAHEATGLQGQYDALNSQMTEQNLNTIGSMQQSLFNNTLNLQTFPALQNYQQKLNIQQGLFKLGGMGLGAMIGGPVGAGIGGNISGNMFSGGGLNLPSGVNNGSFNQYLNYPQYNGSMRNVNQ